MILQMSSRSSSRRTYRLGSKVTNPQTKMNSSFNEQLFHLREQVAFKRELDFFPKTFFFTDDRSWGTSSERQINAIFGQDFKTFCKTSFSFFF